MRFASCAVLLVASGTLAPAVSLPGGGGPRPDCYAVLDVDGAAPASPRAASCTDGDAACDHDGVCNQVCRFRVRLCLNQPDVPRCVPPSPPARLKRAAGPLPPPPDGSACGAFVDLDVPVGADRRDTVLRPGKLKLRVVAASRTRRDVDRFQLVCAPSAAPCPSPVAPLGCPRNAAGGPNGLDVRVLPEGNDRDFGWTGVTHNLPVPSGIALRSCLTGCDGRRDRVCDASGSTGEGSLNGSTFGPPLPRLAAGRPMCIVERYDGPLSGTVDLGTGAVDVRVPIVADYYSFGDNAHVCPRCRAGVCDSGRNAGQGCTIDALVPVSDVVSDVYEVSRDCPPSRSPFASIPILLPLTTETRTTPGTGGSKPCREDEALGVPARDNNCAAGCGARCRDGSNVCVARVPDPANPGATVCLDRRGGLTQVCCNDDPDLSCHPTGPGEPGLVRTGRGVPPRPVYQHAYPRVADGTVLVATFCEAPTGSSGGDTIAGFPGPGAMILNTRMFLLQEP